MRIPLSLDTVLRLFKYCSQRNSSSFYQKNSLHRRSVLMEANLLKSMHLTCIITCRPSTDFELSLAHSHNPWLIGFWHYRLALRQLEIYFPMLERRRLNSTYCLIVIKCKSTTSLISNFNSSKSSRNCFRYDSFSLAAL